MLRFLTILKKSQSTDHKMKGIENVENDELSRDIMLNKDSNQRDILQGTIQ